MGVIDAEKTYIRDTVELRSRVACTLKTSVCLVTFSYQLMLEISALPSARSLFAKNIESFIDRMGRIEPTQSLYSSTSHHTANLFVTSKLLNSEISCAHSFTYI